jgi:hypothetical protein
MSEMSCSYDCSKRLTVVSPYPDISGIGVRSTRQVLSSAVNAR